MDETKLEGALNELVREFGGVADPQCKKLVIPAKKERGGQRRVAGHAGSVQESLDYLRVCIKYQLLDLEATRRENEYLRTLLGDKEN
jgi:hypothetical protein